VNLAGCPGALVPGGRKGKGDISGKSARLAPSMLLDTVHIADYPYLSGILLVRQR
jgi:hypothetical protein